MEPNAENAPRSNRTERFDGWQNWLGCEGDRAKQYILMAKLVGFMHNIVSNVLLYGMHAIKKMFGSHWGQDEKKTPQGKVGPFNKNRS